MKVKRKTQKTPHYSFQIFFGIVTVLHTMALMNSCTKNKIFFAILVTIMIFIFTVLTFYNFGIEKKNR